MKLDELLTISEALEQLKKETGVAWTEAAFLSATYEIGIELQALPPITAGVDKPDGYAMDASGKLCPVTRKQWRMASLKSSNIKQLMLSGEALVHEAVKRENIHDKDYIQSLVEISEYFTSPVQVDCEMVRVPGCVINKLTSCPETWPTASAEKIAVPPDTPPTDNPSPWLIAELNDPKPEQTWYTPARYFARQLVIGDTTLLVKRKLLSEKVAQSLSSAGIKKRGDKLPIAAATVLKALANVSLG